MKIIRLLAISLTASALIACVKTQIEGGGNLVDPNKLHILFTIPDQVPGTYATVETLPAEREFDEAYVIFYDASGKYVAHTSNNTQSTASTGSFEVIKPPTVELGTPYKVLIVANLKYYLDPSYVDTNDYINAYKTLQYDAMQSEIKAVSNNRVFRKLPMYAQAEITLTESGIIPVTFARAVARIDFVCLEKNLDIEWVKVCNYNNAGYFYHDRYNVLASKIINGAGSGDVEEIPKKVYLKRRSEMTDPLAAQSNANGGLYAFPNININTGVNDQKTTCLLFKGTYSYVDKDGTPKTKEAYYRVNVSSLGKPQDLRRNNIYRITVKSVSDGGADDEEGAIKNPTVNVNYEINDWTVDNSMEIITDDQGNYLGISPISAYFGGSKGSAGTGSIKVRPGASWTIEKLAADDWFSVAKTADNSGFILTALTDNAGSNVRSSTVRVKVAGTALQHDLPIYQYTLNGSEDVVLIVDQRMGDFPLTVEATGQTLALPVTLGSSSARAAISWLSGDKAMIKSATPAIGIPGITNNSSSTLVFRSNLTGKARSAIYKVTRSDGVNPDISLNITFTQPAAAQVIVPTPSIIFENNSVDGFMNLTGGANSKKCKFQRVYVTMLDLDSYPKWQATSTFNTYDVALVAKPTVDTDTYPLIGGVQETRAAGASGECFDIAVARCGPGDAPLTGTITIEGCDATGKVVPDGARFTIPLKVYSSLQSGFTQIGNVSGSSNAIWHDRNIGAPQSDIGNESDITIPALPFSGHKDDYQSVNPDEDPNSYQNYRFKGTLFTFTAANTPPNALCPAGWHMPTKVEGETLGKEMQWAKAGTRYYIVANRGENAGKKGCYFSGMLGFSVVAPGSYAGVYWLGELNNSSGYYFFIGQSGTGIYSSATSNSLFVRCVKDL